MIKKLPLIVLFCSIFCSMLLVTGWASLHQSIMDWGGLLGPDRYWTLATLMDAYCGFLTFYAWVVYKEQRWPPRLAWFLAIMLLGNMAMAAYVLLQLLRLPAGEDAARILTARNP